MEKPMTELSIESQLALIRKGAVSIETESELRERLEERRPLRIKYGVDPSAPDIHLGHTVLLNRLRVLQNLGHEAYFIIGDFTARIGDPSGRVKTRPQLTKEEVKRNAGTYLEQVFKVLDPSRTKILFNSEWLNRLTLEDVIALASKVTVAQLIQRDDYAKRYSGGIPISLHEFLYPLIQAYDSIQIHADVEIGGTDQTFNLLLARELQRAYGQRAQVIMTMPLLEGLDGAEKMSKSIGNHIGITDPPFEMYGKIMSISDELMRKYYDLLTGYDYKDLEKEIPHPRDRKARLAWEIVNMFHGEEGAKSAERNFEIAFKRGGVPDWVHVVPVSAGEYRVVSLLKESGLVPSGLEARRKIRAEAVEIDGRRVTDPSATVRILHAPCVIKMGRKFAKIVPR